MIGRVYKIIHNQSDICYVGSTFNELRVRWAQHRQRYSQVKRIPERTMSICKYFKEHGTDNFKIILIKEYEVIDRKQLEAYEQLWINKLKCINEQSSFNPMRKNKLSRKAYFDEYKKKRYTCEQCKIELYWKRKASHERSKAHIHRCVA